MAGRVSFLFAAALVVTAAPAPPTPDLFDYLTRFGYLPESDIETGNLRTDEARREAISNLQEFAGLQKTGELDEATLRLMARPRCGLPDPQLPPGYRYKRYAVHGQKWSYTNLTWSLRTRLGSVVEQGRTRYDLSKALRVWSDHSKLTFKELNSDEADILIYFEKGYHGDGYPFDGRGQVLAHAFFPGSGRGGDVHFDIEEHWSLSGDSESNGEKTSLLSVAAHEFGHSLGLAHSSVPGALMYPWYQGFGDLDLHEDDKHAIQQLYGAKEKQWGKNYGQRPYWPPYHTPYRPTTTTTTSTTTTTRRTTTRRPVTTQPPSPEIPETCNTSYDAISVIRRELFIFRGKYTWRVGDKGLHRGYPALAERIWSELPSNFSQIDAVYERHDKKIVFFIGKRYYVFQGNFLEPGYPKPLSALGLPHTLEKIDAAMIWSYNSKTYLFSGTMYWKLDEDMGLVEQDYPRDIQRVWKGVGYNIDSAFQWTDGNTYFFRGLYFWRFDDVKMRVADVSPKLSSVFWMHCKSQSSPPEPTTPSPPVTPPDPSSGHFNKPCHCLITLLFFFIISCQKL